MTILILFTPTKQIFLYKYDGYNKFGNNALKSLIKSIPYSINFSQLSNLLHFV